MITEIKTGVSNYYGEVKFIEREGKYYMTLENWDGDDEVEISKEFFEAAMDEFVLKRADQPDNSGFLKCEECGVVNETVKVCFDPYVEEIHGEQKEVQICSECYTNSCMEI